MKIDEVAVGDTVLHLTSNAVATVTRITDGGEVILSFGTSVPLWTRACFLEPLIQIFPRPLTQTQGVTT